MIPDEVYEEAKVNEGETDDGTPVFCDRVGVLRWNLTHLKFVDSNILCFKNLSRLAEVVLAILYSNAELEYLFSIVRKKENDTRSLLKLVGSRCPQGHVPRY